MGGIIDEIPIFQKIFNPGVPPRKEILNQFPRRGGPGASLVDTVV